MSIRDSDYALAAAAAQLTLDGSDNCKKLSLSICGASPTAIRLKPVEESLLGKPPLNQVIVEACEIIDDLIDPQADVHADANYRGRVAKVMARRAISDARDRAKGFLK